MPNPYKIISMRTVRGSVGIFFIVIIIALGSVLLVGGIFPKNPDLSAPQYRGVPDDTIKPGNGKRSLQLGTIPFKQCVETTMVNFLIDNSGSMQGAKMTELKNAMAVFGSNYPDSGVLGIQIYSDPATHPPLGYAELIPISEYIKVKNQYISLINRMRPSGATHSKDAMIFAKTKLEEAKRLFPDRQANLVFISDGIPETRETKNALCPGDVPNSPLCSISRSPAGAPVCRCFAQSQDPTSVASEIKAMGVRIFTISYVDTQDSKFNNELQTLMRNVASSPADYYQAPVADQIGKILAQISEKLCN
jgi:hypothetical protein